MKRIILLLLTIIGCSLILFICSSIRSELKRNEIKEEMYSRLGILVQHTNTVTAAEYVPFIWDTEYSYECSTSLEDFTTLTEGKAVKYIKLDEVNHRQIFLNNNAVIFDTGRLRLEYWGFWSPGKLTPQEQLNIKGSSEFISILFGG